MPAEFTTSVNIRTIRRDDSGDTSITRRPFFGGSAKVALSIAPGVAATITWRQARSGRARLRPSFFSGHGVTRPGSGRASPSHSSSAAYGPEQGMPDQANRRDWAG